MIISHKHKFIFIKTHKTATQTFYKFIKKHLGLDDVMAGDPANNRSGDENVVDTQVNVDKPFKSTGKSALDYKQDYGNHLPWFMIKDIVGNEIWETYTKFTIERDPYDRILSLFFFNNPTIVKPGILISQEKKEQHVKDKTFSKVLSWMNQNSLLTAFPDEIREYFEEWCFVQFKSPVLPLCDYDTYGAVANAKEVSTYLQTAQALNLKRFVNTFQAMTKWRNPNNGQEFQSFPYLKDPEIVLWKRPFEEGWPLYGQCRFLNYGNYFDGESLQVDHVLNFNDLGNNLGRFFASAGIQIECNKKLFDQAIQNHHYRKNIKFTKDNDWWYSGKRSHSLRTTIDRIFFGNKFNIKKNYFND